MTMCTHCQYGQLPIEAVDYCNDQQPGLGYEFAANISTIMNKEDSLSTPSADIILVIAVMYTKRDRIY